MGESVFISPWRMNAMQREEENQKFRSIFELSPNSIITVNTKGVITTSNPAATRMLGYSNDEMVGKHFSKIGVIRVRDLPKFMKLFKSILRGEVAKVVELPFQRKDGTQLLAEIRVTLLKSHGKTIGIQAISTDITERKKVDEQMIRLSTAVNTSMDGIIICDIDGNVVDVNWAVLKKHGLTRKAEMIGKNAAEFIAPEDKEKVIAAVRKLTKKGYIEGLEYHIITDDGSKIPVEANGVVMKNKDGTPIGFVTTVRDITERKKSEEALKQAEEKHRILLDSANALVQSVNAEGKFVYVNSEWKKILGYTDKDLQKITLMDIIRKDHHEYCRNIFRQVMNGQSVSNIDSVLVAKDGREIYVSGNARPIFRDGEFASTVGFFVDVTERRRMEEALRESEEKYRNIVQMSPDSIVTLNLKGVITSANPTTLRLLCYSENEIVGKHFTKLGTMRARDIPRFMKLFASTIRGRVPKPIEATWQTKDGNTYVTEIHVSLMKKEGKIIGIQAVTRDITERMDAQRKLKAINEKLGVVGGLTRHDARNKLATILGNTFLAKQKLACNHETLKNLSEIESATADVERIFAFARTYERLGLEKLVYMDVDKALADSFAMFTDLSKVKIEKECYGLEVIADSLLRRLFYNLIDNSLKYGERISRIRVYYRSEKDHLKLIYEDDGVGISRTEKEKIFNKGYGKGTGYGLYLIRKICEVYGWTIRETGKHGKGGQFTITIPRKATRIKQV